MTDEILDQASSTGDAIEKKQRRTRWLLWLQWVLVCALGFVVAGSLIPDPVGWRLSGILGAVWLIEAVLWLLLWRRYFGTGWWTVVTLVGLASAALPPSLAVDIFFGQLDPGVDFVIASAVVLVLGVPAGLLIGLGHWLILRRQVPRAVRWIWSTVLAYVAGGGAAVVAGDALVPAPSWAGHDLAVGVSMAVGGAVYGAITGLTLNTLSSEPVGAGGRRLQRYLGAVGVLLSWVAVICLGWAMLAPPVNKQLLFVQSRLGRRGFSTLSLEGSDLRGADLRGADLRGADLHEADLGGGIL